MAMDKLLVQLRDAFALKDLGPLHYYLGIEVTSCPSGGLLLRQSKYAKELIHKAGLKNCKPSSTPMATTKKVGSSCW